MPLPRRRKINRLADSLGAVGEESPVAEHKCVRSCPALKRHAGAAIAGKSGKPPPWRARDSGPRFARLRVKLAGNERKAAYTRHEYTAHALLRGSHPG